MAIFPDDENILYGRLTGETVNHTGSATDLFVAVRARQASHLTGYLVHIPALQPHRADDAK